MHSSGSIRHNNSNENLSIVVAFCVLVFVILITVFVALANCYCGRENEYTAIVDNDYSEDDIEMPGLIEISSSPKEETPIEPTDTTTTATNTLDTNRKRTTPTISTEQRSPADILAQEIDYFVRHREDFYATGYYCSVVVLENHINFVDKWKTKSLRDFLRRRSEFKTRSNMTAFKLTALTPFREADVQVSGKFQCVNINCRYHWESYCTYADHYQKCKQCHARVYPFEQNLLSSAEIEEYYRNPVDENYYDATDVAFAMKRDAVDILAHTVSPVRPVLNSYQQTNKER